MKKLYDLLIAAGTDGATQNDIVKKLQGTYSGPLIITVLEDWMEHGAVQKFEVPRVTRPATVWRATTTLNESGMRQRNQIVDFYGDILEETDDEIRFNYQDEETVSLVKTHIEIDRTGVMTLVSLPRWMAESKGMVL